MKLLSFTLVYLFVVACGKKASTGTAISIAPQTSCDSHSGYAVKATEGEVSIYQIDKISGDKSFIVNVEGARSLWAGKGAVYVSKSHQLYLVAANEDLKSKLYRIDLRSKTTLEYDLLDDFSGVTLAGLGHDLNIYGIGFKNNKAKALKLDLETEEVKELGEVPGMLRMVNSQVQMDCDGEHLYALAETSGGDRLFEYDLIADKSQSVSDSLGIETFMMSPDSGEILALKQSGSELKLYSIQIGAGGMNSVLLNKVAGVNSWVFSSIYDYGSNSIFIIGNSDKLYQYDYEKDLVSDAINVEYNFQLSKN